MNQITLEMLFESIILAGIGGFFGATGRYLVGVVSKKIFNSTYPFVTFIVNIAGCFLLGLIFGLWSRHEIYPTVKWLFITGFCGGFTTFSSFTLDMYSLLKAGKYIRFVTYLVTSVAGGLLMVWAGMVIAMRY